MMSFCAGFKTFLTHHHYEGAVSFLPATDILGTPRDKTRCRAGYVTLYTYHLLCSLVLHVCLDVAKEIAHLASQLHSCFPGASYASMTGSCIQGIPQRNPRLLQMSQTEVGTVSLPERTYGLNSTRHGSLLKPAQCFHHKAPTSVSALSQNMKWGGGWSEGSSWPSTRPV